LEVCVVLHYYVIQFLLVSKFRQAMQSKHQTEMTSVSVSKDIINFYNFYNIIYSTGSHLL